MMNFIKGHYYEWILTGEKRHGRYTGRVDNLEGFQNNLIMENESGVLWSINPQYIVAEVDSFKK